MAALLAAAALAAPARAHPLLDGLVTAYEAGQYRRVAALADSSAADTASLSRDERAYLYTYWAFSLVALSREAEAEDKFKLLLALKPETDLNPEFVSPKIIAVFRNARAGQQRAAAPPGRSGSPLVGEGRPAKPGALIRSLAWPGWGQSYRGQARKGRIFKVASLAAVAGLVAAQAGTSYAHNRYLEAGDPGRIEGTYTTYNRWYRARNLAINVAVTVWVLGAVDVMMGD